MPPQTASVGPWLTPQPTMQRQAGRIRADPFTLLQWGLIVYLVPRYSLFNSSAHLLHRSGATQWHGSPWAVIHCLQSASVHPHILHLRNASMLCLAIIIAFQYFPARSGFSCGPQGVCPFHPAAWPSTAILTEDRVRGAGTRSPQP